MGEFIRCVALLGRIDLESSFDACFSDTQCAILYGICL
jgi:hypothetical protein